MSEYRYFLSPINQELVMEKLLSRRTVLSWIPLSVAGYAVLGSPRLSVAQTPKTALLTDYLPSRNPQLAIDTVLYAHTKIEEVASLLRAHPSLANAAIDWGFGDWETAIGAASHMGRRDIAELLIDHGARPDIFTHAMMGHVDVVRAIVGLQPGIQGTLGPHGLTMLHHARAGKEQAAEVVAYLESVGGADPVPNTAELLLPVEAYVGEYRFGPGDDAILTVTSKNQRLRLKAAKGFPRDLYHMGSHRFYPTGAPSVAISFKTEGERAVEFSIIDDSPLLTAARVA
jgi:hypothetical protein